MVTRYGHPTPTDKLQEQMQQDARKWLIVQLHILWFAFCQELVTRSALGNVITLGGLWLPRAPNVKTPADVEKVAVHGRRMFPSWHHAQFTVGAAQRLGLANFAQIAGGIGAPSPSEDLTGIRNYLAHPNRRNAGAYRQISIRLVGNYRDPADLLAIRRPGGATLFGEWVSQFYLNAHAAIS